MQMHLKCSCKIWSKQLQLDCVHSWYNQSCQKLNIKKWRRILGISGKFVEYAHQSLVSIYSIL